MSDSYVQNKVTTFWQEVKKEEVESHKLKVVSRRMNQEFSLARKQLSIITEEVTEEVKSS
jgi:hypothetical protein